MDAYALHIVNHVLKAREIVLRNNAYVVTDIVVSKVPRSSVYALLMSCGRKLNAYRAKVVEKQKDLMFEQRSKNIKVKKRVS